MLRFKKRPLTLQDILNTNEGDKNLVLLLFPQYTKLLFEQIGINWYGFSYAAVHFKSKIFFMPIYTRQILLTLTVLFWYITVCLRDKETWGYLHEFLVDNEHRYLIKKHKPTISTFYGYIGVWNLERNWYQDVFLYHDVFFGRCSRQILIFHKKHRYIKKNLISIHITLRYFGLLPPQNWRSKTEKIAKKDPSKCFGIFFCRHCKITCRGNMVLLIKN